MRIFNVFAVGRSGPRALTLAVAAAFTAVFTTTNPQAQATGYISPSRAVANRAFQLNLSGSTGTGSCLSLGNPKAVVTDTLIDLTLQTLIVPTAPGVPPVPGTPGSVCTTGDYPINFDFHLPALKPGVYAVRGYILPTCMLANPACLIAPLPFVTSQLVVSAPEGLYYSISPKQAPAAKEFDLFLTSKNYSCADEFLNLESSVNGRTLMLTYTVRNDPAIRCAKPIQDLGPTFKIPAMTDGTYQVFASPNPYCPPGTICPLAKIAPQLAGALDIGDPTGIGKTATHSTRNGSQPLHGNALQGKGYGGTFSLWQGFRWDLMGRRPAADRRASGLFQHAVMEIQP